MEDTNGKLPKEEAPNDEQKDESLHSYSEDYEIPLIVNDQDQDEDYYAHYEEDRDLVDVVEEMAEDPKKLRKALDDQLGFGIGVVDYTVMDFGEDCTIKNFTPDMTEEKANENAMFVRSAGFERLARNKFNDKNTVQFSEEAIKSIEHLQVYKERERILKAIEKNDVILLKCSTGSGKSTILPLLLVWQFLNAKVMEVLPTRLAAHSSGDRAQKTMPEVVGVLTSEISSYDAVGTKVLYCTAGVATGLLDQEGENFTHYVLDEFHNRPLEITQLIEKIRSKLKSTLQHRPKLILMTATFSDDDVDQLKKYFTGHVFSVVELAGLPPHPIIQISKFEILNITDIISYTEGSEDHEEYRIGNLMDDNALERTLKTLRMNNIQDIKAAMKEYDKCCADKQVTASADLIAAISTLISGRMLVFVAGIDEINALEDKLGDVDRYEGVPRVVGLHSSLPRDDKDLSGTEKLIFIGTNIAETSLTINDLDLVLDFGLRKIKKFTHFTSESKLSAVPIDEHSMVQRMGRVGRTKRGIYVQFYDKDMLSKVNLKINESLYAIVLKYSKLLDNPKEQLVNKLCNELYDTAVENEVIACVENMKRTGLLKHVDWKPTLIGQLASRLPFNALFCHVPVFGLLFRCVKEVVQLTVSNYGEPVYDQHAFKSKIKKINATDEEAQKKDKARKNFEKATMSRASLNIFAADAQTYFTEFVKKKGLKAACKDKEALMFEGVKLKKRQCHDAHKLYLRCISGLSTSLHVGHGKRAEDNQFNLHTGNGIKRGIFSMCTFPMFAASLGIVHPKTREFYLSRGANQAAKVNYRAWVPSDSIVLYTCEDGANRVDATAVSPKLFAIFAGLFDDEKKTVVRQENCSISFNGPGTFTLRIMFGDSDAFNRLLETRDVIKKYITTAIEFPDWWDSPQAKEVCEKIVNLAEKLEHEFMEFAKEKAKSYESS